MILILLFLLAIAFSALLALHPRKQRDVGLLAGWSRDFRALNRMPSFRESIAIVSLIAAIFLLAALANR
jgi:hypothetical protein